MSGCFLETVVVHISLLLIIISLNPESWCTLKDCCRPSLSLGVLEFREGYEDLLIWAVCFP